MILEGDVRRGLTTLPGELATGLSEPRGLAELLRTAADASPALAGGLRGLRGTDRDVDLRRLIEGSAATLAALDTPTDELQHARWRRGGDARDDRGARGRSAPDAGRRAGRDPAGALDAGAAGGDARPVPTV